MKKILVAISIIMLLICAGCVPKLNPIETGEYYADGEKENKFFKKAKLGKALILNGIRAFLFV